MARSRRGVPARFRVGQVSVYFHHGSWWAYYREHGRPIRKKIATSASDAKQIAAQLNLQLATNTPTTLAFNPITVSDLRRQFLDYHEHVLNSSVATLARYRTATRYLEDFVGRNAKAAQAHEVNPESFVIHLRTIEVAANGHPNTRRRRLLDKGIRFILETCRSMYHFAVKRRHLPPYAANPFAELPLDRFRIENAKKIFVFDAATELKFLKAADFWAFPIHFTLAKTGMRVGELVHLLIEDLDLHAGWLHVRNKPRLSWRIKTGRERAIPLMPESVTVIRYVIGRRQAGPVFLRRRFTEGAAPTLIGDLRSLESIYDERRQHEGSSGSRADELRVAQTVWRDAGAIKADAIRVSFIRIMRDIGHPESTCPKSWRHTYATLLQDANVDPLIRQVTLGHSPTTGGGLGMTANYTHTRPETQRRQIESALRLWPESLAFARHVIDPASHDAIATALPNPNIHMEVIS